MASAPAKQMAATLDTEVRFLPGVGPKRGAALGKLGVATIADLIEYFPVRHDRYFRTTIEMLEVGTIATVIGRITAFRGRRHARGPAAQAAVQDNTGRCSVTWFNASYVFDQLDKGAIVELTGKVGEYGGLPQFVNPSFRLLDESADPIATPEEKRGQSPTLEPVYPATAELGSRAIAKLINVILPAALPLVRELYPAAFRAARQLPPRPTAIERMHHPTSQEDVEVARRRLAYDELLILQVAVQMARRNRLEGAAADALPCMAEIDARIRRRFPFKLTDAQDRVVREIIADLEGQHPMNRLLQGDVGSGKTAVAVYAALVAIANRRQVAVLAPTELLAQQHHRSFGRLLEGSRVRHALWVGGGTKKEREEMRRAAQAGELDLVVGTQALLEQDVQFKGLGLVIVDEQHRFGVRQRAMIRSKGAAPHYLVMTATPIPRTLAMTVFGDLDVSTIDALPPDRAPIQTKVIGPSQFDHAWQFVRSRLKLGEQAYIVYPRLEESEDVPLRAAKSEVSRIAAECLAGFRVGLLHGQMAADEKDAVMRDFAAGRVQALVATTVIEVGIDVPNATVMVIQHADRYGLAQLHQLRGRIGRGGKTGYCYLMVESAGGPSLVSPHDDPRKTAKVRASLPACSETARQASPLNNYRADPQSDARNRLNVLTRTTDGFLIAEEDLRQRGPGELLGTRQHGLPALRVADLLRDFELLRMAQRDAAEIIRGDARLEQAEWRELRQALLARYGQTMRFLEGA